MLAIEKASSIDDIKKYLQRADSQETQLFLFLLHLTCKNKLNHFIFTTSD